MLSLKIHGAIDEVPQEAWDALAVPAEGPFIEHEWLSALEDTGCLGAEEGWLPRHFTLWRGSDLVAAAPAYVKGHSEGEFVFDWSWADAARRAGIRYYPKLVFAVPFTPATGDRVLVAPGEDRAAVVGIFAEAARRLCEAEGLSSAHVLFPRDAEAAAWSEAGLIGRAGVQFHWHNDGYRAMGDYLARFNSKKRNQLKREIAQPARSGLAIETLPSPAITPAHVDAMYAFYGSTVDKFGHWGRRYLTRAFFDRVVARFGHRLAWVLARRGDDVVAGAFNVKKGDRLYGRYWGLAQEAASEPFLHFAVCYYHGIAQCIEEGLGVFEPGAGGEHKKARGFLPTITHSAHWIADLRLRRAIDGHLARERDAVRAYVAEEREEMGSLTPKSLENGA
jgi:predicted N-acyltransferase